MSHLRISPQMLALGLTGAALLVYAVIAESEQGYSGGIDRLAETIGMSRNSVLHAVVALIEQDLITKTTNSRGRHANIYKALIPAGETTATDDPWVRAWEGIEL